MLKHLMVAVECRLQSGLDPVTLLHKLETIFSGRRNGFESQVQFLGANPVLVY